MEKTAKFVNETDYKSSWEYCNKKRDEAEALARERMDQIEDLERELAEARRTLTDAHDHIRRLEARIDNLCGQVDAFKYCVRNYMAGDGR